MAVARSKTLMWLTFGVMAAAVAALAIVVLINRSSDPEQKAIDACHARIETSLKAPATANFSQESAESGTDLGTWIVTGVVDSENGFGALARTAYGCRVRESESGDMTVEQVKTDP